MGVEYDVFRREVYFDDEMSMYTYTEIHYDLEETITDAQLEEQKYYAELYAEQGDMLFEYALCQEGPTPVDI